MARRTSRTTGGNGGDGGSIPHHRLLTIGEVAELAGISTSTARRLIKAGKLPGPMDFGNPQLHRYHPLRVREAIGLADLPEPPTGKGS